MSFDHLQAAIEAPLDYYLWCDKCYVISVVKDKCYADKPEIIEALKENIREAIGEIRLHTQSIV